MKYLEEFRFPDAAKEDRFLSSVDGVVSNYYTDNIYPFHVLSALDFNCIDFEQITVLCGGNGSGKSTALNVISNKLQVSRQSPYNTSTWMDNYVELCSFRTDAMIGGEEFSSEGKRKSKYDISDYSHMLTSDDIFQMMIGARVRNDQRLHKSKILFDQVITTKYNGKEERDRLRHLDFETGENVREFKEMVERRKSSFNRYARNHIGQLERGYSNGENSLIRLSDFIQEEGLYMLDEPENSLSCEFQLKLKELIEYSARYCNAQFVIATHSPFLLSLDSAKIYCLDDQPVSVKKWWELDSVKTYYHFFKSHADKFS